MKVIVEFEGRDLDRLEEMNLISFSDDDVYKVAVVEYENGLYLEVDFDQEGAYNGAGHFQMRLTTAMANMIIDNFAAGMEG